MCKKSFNIKTKVSVFYLNVIVLFILEQIMIFLAIEIYFRDCLKMESGLPPPPFHLVIYFIRLEKDTKI